MYYEIVRPCKYFLSTTCRNTWTEPTTKVKGKAWTKNNTFVLCSVSFTLKHVIRDRNKKRSHTTHKKKKELLGDVIQYWMWYAANTLTFTWTLRFATKTFFFARLPFHSGFCSFSLRSFITWKYYMNIHTSNSHHWWPASPITFLNSAFRL